MKRHAVWLLVLSACFVFARVAGSSADEWVSGIEWPEPPVVNPDAQNGVPADAIVLFDGTDMSQWEGGENWKIEDGIAVPQNGGIQTKQAFGDCQLHLEFATPEKVEGSGQGRGNSGVYLMGKYEVQILDSYENPTYFDGQAGAIYKQQPPMVNVSRKPGEWQTFDIIFTAARFNEQGEVATPAFITVLHNGVLVQNHFPIQGNSAWDEPPKYTPLPEKLPIHLQFHGNPVRFRNIWIRELNPIVGKMPEEQKPAEEPQAEQPAAETPQP